jgi:hypothetical protein
MTYLELVIAYSWRFWSRLDWDTFSARQYDTMMLGPVCLVLGRSATFLLIKGGF